MTWEDVKLKILLVDVLRELKRDKEETVLIETNRIREVPMMTWVQWRDIVTYNILSTRELLIYR
jgi:hypothetical protein